MAQADATVEGEMIRSIPLVLVAIVASFGPVPAASSAPDPTVASAEAKLAGASSRQWVLTGVVDYMGVGAGPKCRQGETYTFSAQHQFDITRCIGGALQHTKGTWSVSASSPYDLVLTLQGHAYALSFSDDPRKPQLRLRDRDAGIAKLTQDRILSLSDD
jgi:hypothetical protein